MEKVYKNSRFLKKGYTTGTCAAAASYGAVSMLLKNREIKAVSYITPYGTELELELLDIKREKGAVSCAVRKDSGDDPDVTDGMLIYSRAELIEKGIEIEGGMGIGRVTRAGLDRPVGSCAINSVPLKAIEESAAIACSEAEYEGGIKITIYAPEGENIAKKTLNPQLGIEGGISILGTTGIVEPMSSRAYEDTIRLEMNMLSLKSRYAIAVPGNYGREFALKLGLPDENIVKVSNFIGTAIDCAAEKGFKGLIIIGSCGKLVKLGAGIMNTHSHEADGRMEVLCTAGLRAGCSRDTLLETADCITTEEALDILEKSGFREKTAEIIMERISFYVSRRSSVDTAVIMYSEKYGIIGKTENADRLIDQIMKEVI